MEAGVGWIAVRLGRAFLIGCRHLDHLGGLPIEIGIESMPEVEVVAGWIVVLRG